MKCLSFHISSPNFATAGVPVPLLICGISVAQLNPEQIFYDLMSDNSIVPHS
uniref:Uncharacterized protein n=1 Tax=Arion vulgaris TaxID=1028688 RepID=A0A0B6Y9L3_9EUPU